MFYSLIDTSSTLESKLEIPKIFPDRCLTGKHGIGTDRISIVEKSRNGVTENSQHVETYHMTKRSLRQGLCDSAQVL